MLEVAGFFRLSAASSIDTEVHVIPNGALTAFILNPSKRSYDLIFHSYLNHGRNIDLGWAILARPPYSSSSSGTGV